MTCVIGLLDQNGSIYMGGDSAASADSRKEIRVDPKVFFNNNFIIGYSGSFKLGHILQYNFEPPKMPRNMNIKTYMNTLFVEQVKECFENYLGNLGAFKDGLYNGDWIIGYNGHLFNLNNDLHIGECNKNYMAVGSGAEIALGSLYSTENIKNPVERIELALNASAEFINTVSPPFYILKLESDR